jgi:hypothetical protein
VAELADISTVVFGWCGPDRLVENRFVFTLLPRNGLGLPDGAGTLRFGMSERAAIRLVAPLADVRAAWVCGAAWAFFADYLDINIHIYGGLIDRGRDSGLASIELRRHGGLVPRAPSDVPVVWNDIDLFGYPASEVDQAVRTLIPWAFHPSGGRFDRLAEELGLRLGYSGCRAPRIPSGAANAATGHMPWHQHIQQVPAAPYYVVSAHLVHPDRWP